MKDVKWEDRPLTHDWARARAWRGKKVHAINWPNSSDNYSLQSFCGMSLELGKSALGSTDMAPLDDYSTFTDGLTCCGECVTVIREELMEGSV